MQKQITSMTKNLPNKIFLIGFMASGKTTLAKKLSKYLNYSFIDTDKCIEEQMKKSISEIFKKEGEHFFRKLESKVLTSLINEESKMVVSTGGGMACNQDNLDYMLANGTVVFLELDLKSIKNRVKVSKKNRPLLDKLSEKELIEIIDDLYSKRIEFYKQAHLIINALNVRSLSMEEFKEQLAL